MVVYLQSHGNAKKNDGTHYKVYTPFYKELIKIRKYRSNIAKPNFSYLRKLNNSENLDSLKLIEPKHSQQNIIKQWQIGESASHQILEEFLDNKVKEYKTARDFISTDSTSKLSPYLHFGEISPNQIFNAVQSLDYIGNNEEHFIKELVWRDFSYYQIYYYPELHNKNINQKFDSFKWDNDPTLLKKQVKRTDWHSNSRCWNERTLAGWLYAQSRTDDCCQFSYQKLSYPLEVW